MLRKFLLILTASFLAACGTATTAVEPTQAPQAVQSQPTATAEPVYIRVGIQPFASNLPLYIALEEGYFTEQGLQVELIPIVSQLDLITAMILGEIDVTGSVITSAQFVAIQQTPGLRFVVDKGYLDPNSCSYSAFLARNEVLESGVLDDVSNLIDLVMTTQRTTLYSFYTLDTLLEPFGLTSLDIEIIEIPQENRVDALRSGAVDVAGSAEPSVTRILNSGVAQIWKGYEDVLPEGQMATLWYGQLLTQRNRDAGNRFMVAYLKAVRQYNEGKTERNVELMAEFTNGDPEEARSLCWQAFRSDGSIHFETTIGFQEWAVKHGYMDSVVPIEEFWDGSFIEYAVSVLGD